MADAQRRLRQRSKYFQVFSEMGKTVAVAAIVIAAAHSRALM